MACFPLRIFCSSRGKMSDENPLGSASPSSDGLHSENQSEGSDLHGSEAVAMEQVLADVRIIKETVQRIEKLQQRQHQRATNTSANEMPGCSQPGSDHPDGTRTDQSRSLFGRIL